MYMRNSGGLLLSSLVYYKSVTRFKMLLIVTHWVEQLVMHDHTAQASSDSSSGEWVIRQECTDDVDSQELEKGGVRP